nr:hypothetical protein Iba_chr02fCG1860 [Ipomoea batatas]
MSDPNLHPGKAIVGPIMIPDANLILGKLINSLNGWSKFLCQIQSIINRSEVDMARFATKILGAENAALVSTLHHSFHRHTRGRNLCLLRPPAHSNQLRQEVAVHFQRQTPKTAFPTNGPADTIGVPMRIDLAAAWHEPRVLAWVSLISLQGSSQKLIYGSCSQEPSADPLSTAPATSGWISWKRGGEEFLMDSETTREATFGRKESILRLRSDARKTSDM